METYLILVKHALPEIVESVPARQWKLSEDGRARAKRMAERLWSYHPEIVVSSTEPKAMETAEILANGLELSFESMNGLHEHDRSNTPYISKDGFQSAVREFFDKPGMLVFGNESANEAYERFSKTVRLVIDQHPGKIVVIVAHGTVISLFVSRLTGISPVSLWEELGLPSFVVIDMQSSELIAKENIV